MYEKAVFPFCCSVQRLHYLHSFCWGFFAHQKSITTRCSSCRRRCWYCTKPNIPFLSEHALIRISAATWWLLRGPALYRYRSVRIVSLSRSPRRWKDAAARFGEDFPEPARHRSLAYPKPCFTGSPKRSKPKTFPDHEVQRRDRTLISPMRMFPFMLPANHNGQLTGQHGIHGFGKAGFRNYWQRKNLIFFLESGVHKTRKNLPETRYWKAPCSRYGIAFLKNLNAAYPADAKYSFKNETGNWYGSTPRLYHRL